MNLKSLPINERPREKLIKNGVETLSDIELLAIILSSGNKKEDVLTLSNEILKKYDLKKLSRIKSKILMDSFGIGPAKACQIIASFELGRRISRVHEKKLKIENARDVVKLLSDEMRFLEKENLKAIFLDTKNRINRIETIFVGSLNESVIHPREIFKAAITENSAALILVHNHPSGDPTPSTADIESSIQLVKAGEFLGIPLLDHIIIANGKYFSMREKAII